MISEPRLPSWPCNPKHNSLTQTQNHPTKNPQLLVSSMASSMTLEDRFEQLMKANAEKHAPLEYLRRQLDQAIRNNRREIQSSHCTSETYWCLEKPRRSISSI